MKNFIYEAAPSRVVFGPGTLAQLREEIDRLGLRRVLVLSTEGQAGKAEELRKSVEDCAPLLFPHAAMHTPVGVTEAALAVVRSNDIDGTIAFGGGSTIGLGKALAYRTAMPQIVIPTTYSGSEMTPILGETVDGIKTTVRDPKILPATVIYDVELTLGLPRQASLTSGLNAMAHAAEALYARDSNPVTSLMAEEGIRVLSAALPAIADDGGDIAARTDALYGAWLCGICLGTAGMALHHKLCHVLGGLFNLPHAETHSIVLPHAIAYNTAGAAEAVARIARAMRVGDAAAGLFGLAGRLGVPRALRDIGMPEEGIEQATAIATENPYWNPQPIERDRIKGLIERAWAGAPPKL